MSGNVKKIFMVLVTIVICVLLGAFAINVLLPNGTSTIINATEDMIYKATGMGFDFNNDGNMGDAAGKDYNGTEGGAEGVGTNTVEGFK